MGEVTTTDGLLTVKSAEDIVVVDPGDSSSLPILATNRTSEPMQFTLFVQNLQEGWFSGSEHVTIGGNTEDWLQIKFHPPTSAVKNRYPVDLFFAYSPDRELNSRVSFPGPLAITLSVGAEADSSVAQPAPEPASVRPDGSVYSTTHAVSDSPADRDSLGFDEVADAFAALVESASTEPPTTIGIEGTWGTGKSTLMRMIESRLRSPNIDSLVKSLCRSN